jgi:hypothetical protein
MKTIVNIDTIATGYFPTSSTKLFALCPADRIGGLKIVSVPSYCREGFSVLVSHLVHRQLRAVEGMYVYGHETWNTGDMETVRGKLPMFRDGRFYFGMVVGGKHPSPKEGWKRYENLQRVMGSGIEIAKTNVLEYDGACSTVFVISAPAVFATNTWTMSLLTGVVREIIVPSTQNFLEQLTPKVMDVLFQYVQECTPKKYANLSSYQWSKSFGVHSLWQGARRVVTSYSPRNSPWGGSETLEEVVKYYSYPKTKSAVREVANFLRYLRDTERNGGQTPPRILNGLSNLPL